MNLDKSKKRISKRVKMGDQGYPKIAIEYHGKSINLATEVTVTLIFEEGAEPMTERFSNTADVRENDVIQSALIKIIERTGAKTVSQKSEVTII